MTNLFVVLFYGSLFTIFVVLITPVLTRKAKDHIDFAYLVASLLVMVWLLIEIVIHTISDPGLIAYLYTARLGIFVFASTPFFYLIVLFFNVETQITKWLTAIFTAIAGVFAILAFSGVTQGLFWIGGLQITQIDPLLIITKTASVVYILLLVFTQIPIICVLVIVIAQGRKLPPAYLSSVRLIGSCLVLYTLAVAAFVLGFTQGIGFDSSLIGVSILMYAIYLALIGKKRADYLSVWQGDVFNHLNEAILVVNDKEIIADSNVSAQKLFDSIDISVQGKTLNQLRADIAQADKAFLRVIGDEGLSPLRSDLYITDGEYPFIYEIKLSSIESFAGVGSGSFIILNEVTRNRLFIERLQDLAGVDALTELPNRFSYEQTLNKWDCPENLPLSIIIGDLNGLKKLNDSYGHEMGDEFLKEAAEILKKACPENGFVARIGGDEFVMLLKNCDATEAREIIERIHHHTDTVPQYPFLLSIALGSATKVYPDQNMSMLYVQADAIMYEEKKEEAADI